MTILKLGQYLPPRWLLIGLLTIFMAESPAEEVTREQVIGAVDEQFEQAVVDVRDWVRIPSVTAPGDPFRADKEKMLRAVVQRANQLGLKGWLLEGSQVAVVELPGRSGQSVGILAHADVVPEGELDSWRHPPFSGVLAEDAIWGRGSLDDKGPLAASLHAMAILKKWGLVPRKTVRLIVGSSEENLDWRDLDAVRKAGLTPESGWTPDAAFPVINAEKSFVNAVLRFPAPPGEHGSLALSGGSAPNSVPDNATLRIVAPRSFADLCRETTKTYLGAHPEVALNLETDGDGLKILAVGKAAHGSRPAEGVNAIAHLLGWLQLAARSSEEFKALLSGYPGLLFLQEKINVETNGASLGIRRAGGVLGETTLNLGVVSQEGDEFQVHLNIRGPADLPVTEITGALQSAVTGYQGRVEIAGSMEALQVSADAPLVRELQQAYEKATGNQAKLLAIGGTTYAKAFPGFVAFGMGMPEDHGLAHAANERLRLDRLRKGMEIYLYALLLVAADIEVTNP